MKNNIIPVIDRIDIIKRTFPFFEKDLVTELADVSSIIKLETGESILGEGDYIKSFPMVIDGCLRVLRLSDNGNELLLYYLNQGEICSMSLTCCMSLQKSNIKMIAEETALVLTIPVDKPEKWMSDYRTWKEFMMYSFKKRFDELLDTIDSIAFTQLDQRLIRFFEERFSSTGNSIFTGTHQDIAIQLNTSREVISRLLRNLEKQNFIITERNSVDYSNLVRK